MGRGDTDGSAINEGLNMHYRQDVAISVEKSVGLPGIHIFLEYNYLIY